MYRGTACNTRLVPASVPFSRAGITYGVMHPAFSSCKVRRVTHRNVCRDINFCTQRSERERAGWRMRIWIRAAVRDGLHEISSAKLFIIMYLAVNTV